MNILLTNEYIINVTEIVNDTVFGYDMVSEDFVRVDVKECFPFSKSIIKLLGSERLRFLIASQCAEHEDQIADILGVSERTVFRMQKREKMFIEKPSEIN